MGRRLSNQERAHRIIGKVSVREMKAKGKCRLCKRAIAKGEKALRYMDVNPHAGRKREVGICMDCAVVLWPYAEESIYKVSAAVEEHENALRESGDMTDEMIIALDAARTSRIQCSRPNPTPRVDASPVPPDPVPRDPVPTTTKPISAPPPPVNPGPVDLRAPTFDEIDMRIRQAQKYHERINAMMRGKSP